MKAQAIRTQGRYRLTRSSRGIDELVTVKRLRIEERTPHNGPTYLHVEIECLTCDGTLLTCGPSKLHPIEGEIYPNPCRASRRIAKWNEGRIARATTLRGQWSPMPASQLATYIGELETITFSHPTERQLAERMSDLGVAFDYERTTFKAGKKGFQPDFYLPAIDAYMEITSLPSCDVKREKLDHMAMHLPDVLVFALGADGIEAMLQSADAADFLSRAGRALAWERAVGDERRARMERQIRRAARRKQLKRARELAGA